jgi:hypothetical protein
MNLIATSNPESIASAIEPGRRTELAKVEQALAPILSRWRTESDPPPPVVYRCFYLEAAIRRHRETVIPPLQAIAEGHGGESGPHRLDAAKMLVAVDPHIGFRTLSGLLKSDDSAGLSETLREAALEPISQELGLKPNVPFALPVELSGRVYDASRHRLWHDIARIVGDVERKLSVEERIPWRNPRDAETALNIAVRAVEGYELLFERGADINALDDRAHTPLDLAHILDRRMPFGDLLEDRGGKWQV